MTTVVQVFACMALAVILTGRTFAAVRWARRRIDRRVQVTLAAHPQVGRDARRIARAGPPHYGRPTCPLFFPAYETRVGWVWCFYWTDPDSGQQHERSGWAVTYNRAVLHAERAHLRALAYYIESLGRTVAPRPGGAGR